MEESRGIVHGGVGLTKALRTSRHQRSSTGSVHVSTYSLAVVLLNGVREAILR